MNRRVLVIPTGGLRREGITSSILALVRAMDRSGLDVRIAAVYNNEADVVEEFRSLGCEVVETPDRRSDTLGYTRFIFRYMKGNDIDVVHVHGSSSVMAIELRLAQLAGVKERIAHSRNTKSDDPRRDRLLRPIFRGSWTRALACGRDAGKWLFESKPFEVFHNGHDLDRFSFDPAARDVMRKKLGLGSDDRAVGFVGNINYVKNPTYLLEVFSSLIGDGEPSRLFIIGEGPDRAKVEKLSSELSLDGLVAITGRVSNVSDYLQAMDFMLLPSLFEGLPNVVLEWQASGLPCLVSDVVTGECAVSDLVEFRSIGEEPEAWAARIRAQLGSVSLAEREGRSAAACIALRRNGFEVNEEAKRLRNIYLGAR